MSVTKTDQQITFEIVHNYKRRAERIRAFRETLRAGQDASASLEGQRAMTARLAHLSAAAGAWDTAASELERALKFNLEIGEVA